MLTLAVDTVMCVRLPNPEGVLAALGFATQLVFLLMVMMMGLSVGTVALVARAHGAKEHAQVGHVLRQSMMLTVGVSAVVAVVGNLSADSLLQLLGAENEVRQIALRYLRPLLTFSIFYYLNILLAAVLRGVGNTSLAFKVALISNALNIAINYGLILGNFGLPKMGVQGAAIGTVVANCVAVCITTTLLARGAVPGIKLSLKFVAVDWKLAKTLFRIGAPASLDMLILNAAFLSIIGMLADIGEAAVAAHTVGLRIQSLAFVPGLSISQATGAMVGNALGAKDSEGAKSVVRSSIVLCVGIMSVLGVALIAGENALLHLFRIEPGTHLAQLATSWMRLLGIGMPIVGAHISFIGMFRGAGATNTSLKINVYGTLFQVPLSYVLGFVVGWGAWGVWAAFPISFVAKLLMGSYGYKKGDWAKTGSAI